MAENGVFGRSFWGFSAKNSVFRTSKVLEILKNFFQEVFKWVFRGNAPKEQFKSKSKSLGRGEIPHRR